MSSEPKKTILDDGWNTKILVKHISDENGFHILDAAFWHVNSDYSYDFVHAGMWTFTLKSYGRNHKTEKAWGKNYDEFINSDYGLAKLNTIITDDEDWHRVGNLEKVNISEFLRNKIRILRVKVPASSKHHPDLENCVKENSIYKQLLSFFKMEPDDVRVYDIGFENDILDFKMKRSLDHRGLRTYFKKAPFLYQVRTGTDA